jgi:hypothetical protein
MALTPLKISLHNQSFFAAGGSAARHEDILAIFLRVVAPTSNELDRRLAKLLGWTVNNTHRRVS